MVENNVRSERQRLGLTQGKLAQLLPDDLNAIAIGLIEKGCLLPTRESLNALCDVFVCEPACLYFPDDLDLLSHSHCDDSFAYQNTSPAPVRSNRQHSGMTEFRAWLRPNEKAALEEAISQLGYRSSAEWLREMLRNTVARNRRLAAPRSVK